MTITRLQRVLDERGRYAVVAQRNQKDEARREPGIDVVQLASDQDASH